MQNLTRKGFFLWWCSLTGVAQQSEMRT